MFVEFGIPEWIMVIFLFWEVIVSLFNYRTTIHKWTISIWIGVISGLTVRIGGLIWVLHEGGFW